MFSDEIILLFFLLLSMMPLAYMVFSDCILPEIKKHKKRHVTFNVVISEEIKGDDFNDTLINRIYELHNLNTSGSVIDALVDIQKNLEPIGNMRYNESSSYHKMIKDRAVDFIKYVIEYDENLMKESRLSHQIRLIGNTLDGDTIETIKRFQ